MSSDILTPPAPTIRKSRELRDIEILEHRQECRKDLVKWAQHYMKDYGYSPALHHKLLLRKLQEVTDGVMFHSQTGNPCRRLMVLMPPGSAKSTYSSIIYPAWFLQRRERCEILSFSCNSELIERFSRRTRDCVKNHSKVLGYELARNSKAVQEWATTNGGNYRCAGVGGLTTGRRAHCGLIDDYIGSEEDANSKIVRDKQYDWYVNDYSPRLFPKDGIQIIVANRRHEDDLVGRLLAAEESKWEVIRIPYFAEENDPLGRKPGDRLWPEWYTEQHANEEVLTKPPRTRSGLWQQRPAPEEGGFFQKAWMQGYDLEQYEFLQKQIKEGNVRVFGGGDWACSDEKDANRTCFGGAVLDSRGCLYIMPDLFWETALPDRTVNAFVSFLERRNPLQFWSEKGHITKSWGPFLRKEMLDRQVYNYISEIHPSREKDVRAQSIRGLMSMMKVYFPIFAQWWPRAMHEMLMFPGGREDDFVDFLSILGIGINSMVKASPAKRQDDEEDVNVPMKPITFSWLKKEHEKRIRQTQPTYKDL